MDSGGNAERQSRPLDRLSMTEVAIPRDFFDGILRLIGELRPPPLHRQRNAFDLSRVPSRALGDMRVEADDTAISAFGLTSARPDTLRKLVGDSPGGGPGLRGTPNSRRLGLN